MKSACVALVLGGALLGAGGAAQAAFCPEPTPPGRYSKPTKPHKPTKPFCVNELMRTHTCSDWQASSYNNEVERYNSELRSYRQQVSEYARKLDRYVEEVNAYVRCEARDVLDQ